MEQQGRIRGEGTDMKQGMRVWPLVGLVLSGLSVAHAQPCFTREVNGTPVTDCDAKLPFEMPTGKPGELHSGTLDGLRQGFGAQAEDANARAAAAGGAPDPVWQGRPGEFGLPGSDGKTPPFVFDSIEGRAVKRRQHGSMLNTPCMDAILV
jgi:hypothetical protein